MADFVGAIRSKEEVTALLEPEADVRASILAASGVFAEISPADPSAVLLAKVEVVGLLEEKS